MSSDRHVTGTMLRDIVVCERRAWLDVHGDADAREEVSSFVELLWDEGIAHEDAVLSRLEGEVVDLRPLPRTEVRAATLAALGGDADHVLGVEIVSGDLLGRPDIVSRVGRRFVAGDAKSGSPFAPDGRRPRKEYLSQVGLYARILAETGLGDGSRAFVIGPADVRGEYDLAADGAAASAFIDALVVRARGMLAGTEAARGAMAASCSLCHWRTVCGAELEAADDLTLIPGLGRSLRASIETAAPTRAALAALDVAALARPGGRSTLPGVGSARLARMRDRAALQLDPSGAPYATAPLGLAPSSLEWHLDVEADPTDGGLVYLHGVWERRRAPDGCLAERFVHFLAEGREGERDAFAGLWAFLMSEPDAMIYHYSAYERTAYRGLQRRHPDVCSAEDVEALFASPRVVDLYSDAVAPLTEWPLRSYGIKAIAKSRGFSWAAADAGGAASISWYREWRRTGDNAVRDRILDYNRSDCIASAVVLDALLELPVRPR